MSAIQSMVLTSTARLLGWFTLLLGSVALVLPWTTAGIGKRFAIAAYLSIATLVLGIAAVLINRHALPPRSRVPAIALLYGIAVVLLFAWMTYGLTSLGTAH